MLVFSKMRTVTLKKFQNTIWRYYRAHGRTLPWRRTRIPYKILISEVMLQQTQVERVLKKYKEFLRAFPNFAVLASASAVETLRVWQGMGYNRRALALKRTAEIVMREYGGKLPRSIEELDALPGIGTYTAGAIAAFAFNLPVICIETNIRRVYIHFFFKDKKSVRDEEIERLVAETLDKKNPRKWYWALMDYGAMLAKEVENPNRRSAHYRVQAKFKGSNRELRGKLIRLFLAKRKWSEEELAKELKETTMRAGEGLADLFQEGFIEKYRGSYRLKER